ncbi:MAG TPA: ABC transporter substrate-binding protein [Candidatus Dormibacteraeota bacterium]|nr:ABC transporter substrate-binding protein [Candidatus Dormibacteraeota bacterium]
MASLTVLCAACEGSTSSLPRPPAVGGVVTIGNSTGTLWSCGFNPFNVAVSGESLGLIYETLVYDNLLNDKKTPWLASSYQWSTDNKTLTFTIRSGVHWTDGQLFGAADVVYTFNLLKQHPELDTQSVWTGLSSVAQVGTDKVVMTFAKPSVMSFYQIAGQTAIVPQHIWTNVKDPVTEAMPNPVGTGPFTTGASSCSPQNITYTRNPNYWQKGLPHLRNVYYPAFTDNDAANQYLISGSAEWGGQFIPNIDTSYIAKDKANYHYWFPPLHNVNLWFKFNVAPLDNKLVRQAFAYAIDRGSVSQKGEYGYEPAANQTGVITPTFSSWIDTAAAAKYNYKFNPAKAISLLQQAGFTKNSSGIFQDSSGKTLSFKVITIGGYTDWVASLQVIHDNLKQAGIEITVQNESGSDFVNDLEIGKFQLAYGSLATSVGPHPYYELRNLLHSPSATDTSLTPTGNFGRYVNPTVDGLLDQFGATTDPAQQHKLMNQIEAIMLEDVPVIPVTESVAWYEYSTKTLAGWPTKSDQFAAPAPWNLPDMEVTLLHLYKSS